MVEIIIQNEPLDGEAGLRLSRAFNRELCDRYPELVLGDDPNGLEASGGEFFVGYVDGEPVCCGAFRSEVDGAAEFKRIFVTSGSRQLGLARKMLNYLENEARQAGFTRAVLDTGIRQPEAIGLYLSAGWKRIEPFGSYADDPSSVCFGKPLANNSRDPHA